MYFDYDLHDAYKPRMLHQSEWDVWARYSFHHTTSAELKTFLRYLDRRKQLSGASRLPTQDILIESLLENSHVPSAIILQEVREDSLMVDFVSVCLDDVGDQDERILEIANTLQIARSFSIEMKKKNIYPMFNSIVLADSVGSHVLKAAASLGEIFKVFEPSRGEKYRFELQC